MAIVGSSLGVDLGSANTCVCLTGQGVALRESTYVLSNAYDPADIIAVGDDARAMLGRTSEESVLLSPVIDGAVADCDMAATLLTTLTEKAVGRRRPMDKARVAASMAMGATKVEREALMRTLALSGARRSLAIKSPVAAAVGAHVDFHEPKGVMQIVIGGSVTEIAVLSLNGVAAARSLRLGGGFMDEAVARYLRHKKNILVGLRTAEDLKMDLGCAVKPEEIVTVKVKGRNVITGKPETVEITNEDIFQALETPIDMLLDAIKDALSNTPAELAGGIMDEGMHVSGGGAMLVNLDKRLHEETNLPVMTSDHPQDDVAIGLALIAGEERAIAKLVSTGALFEG